MVILIAGSSHTGKTLFAQRLLEKYKYPYLSIDHLKMGLIRSGKCSLSAESDDSQLTSYLWPVVKEIIKTNIENSQNIIIEGCYIPFGWDNDFTAEYIQYIKYVCLIFSEEYINDNFSQICKYRNVIEQRQHEDIDEKALLDENDYNLRMCKMYNYNYILIDSIYEINLDEICN